MRAWRYLLPALAIVAIGGALWTTGRFEQRRVDARRQLLMMRFDTPAAEFDAVERASRFVPALAPVERWRAGVRRARDESHYWRHDYAAVTRAAEGTSDGDTAALLLTANAAYRDATAQPATASSVERLDEIARMYLDVLEQDPASIEAAYNYEFIQRTRTALAATVASARNRNARAAPPSTRSSTTLHGAAGVQPEAPDLGEFKIIVPQRPEERRATPDAGRGGAKPRKG
jgi:hypothetical protein